MPTIAAIDVGTNAIRLCIANVNGDRGYQTVYNVRAPVRLGQDVFTKGAISAHTIDKTVETFTEFKQKLEEHAVTHTKAVGTCALREAINRDAVLKAVNKASGIEISIIGGEEEARLIHLAAKATVNLKNKVALLIDIGGGSVEVVLADDTTVLCTESYAMGTVRLLKILDEKAGEERFNRLVTEYVPTQTSIFWFPISCSSRRCVASTYSVTNRLNRSSPAFSSRIFSNLTVPMA